MISKTFNAAHDATVVAAESTLQSAIAAASTQAAMRTFTVTYYRAVLASAVSNGLDQGPFIFALKTLGATV